MSQSKVGYYLDITRRFLIVVSMRSCNGKDKYKSSDVENMIISEVLIVLFIHF